MAELAVSLAGAAIGGFIGGPTGAQIGYAIGSAVGSLAFAEDVKTEGPRIGDGQVTTSAYGQLLPKLWGVYPVAGNIIDATPVRKVAHTEETSAKGGPTQSHTTWTAYTDLDVKICEGEISALLMIRVNGEVHFDASPGAGMVKSDWLDFTLYKGTPDQEPDPTFEALHGAGNVPAYLDEAHVVIRDFPTSQFGNSPVFEFLVAKASSSGTARQATQVSATGETSGYASGVIEPATGLLIFPLTISPTQTYAVTAVDPYTRSVVWQLPADGARRFTRPSLKPKLVETATGIIAQPGELVVAYGADPGDKRLMRIDAVSGTVLEISDPIATGSATVRAVAYDWFDINPRAEAYFITDRGSFNGYDLKRGFAAPVIIAPPDGWVSGYYLVSSGTGKLLVSVQDADISPTAVGVAIYDSGNGSWSAVATLSGILAAARTGDTWWVMTANSPVVIKQIDDDGNILQTVDFSADFSITDSVASGVGSGYLDGMVYNALTNSLLMQGAAAIYELQLDFPGDMPTTYPVAANDTLTLYHPSSGRVWYAPPTSVNAYSANLFAATGQSALLSDIVSELCTDGTALTTSDIDVTALTAISVRGAGVLRPMPRRNMLAQLMTAFMFDFVPRSGKLTTILRGASPAATLTEDHVGAYLRNSGSPPPPWRITHAAASPLPNQVEVTFIDPDHNYEAGAQSARRQASDTGAVQRLSLAVVLSNDEAAQIADTYLHLMHIESEQYDTIAMPSQLAVVQPAAVLSAQVAGDEYTFRVLDGSVIEGRMVSMKAAREVPEVFTSFAVGGSPRASDGSVKALGQSIIWPLDIPLLRNIDNDAGVYVAGSSFTPNWPGAELQRSADGLSYATVGALTEAATMGTAINAPTTGQAGFWDCASVLNVRLISGALSSTALDAPTYAAWGQNGRWEIVAFTVASQHADGYWLVSQMARGMLDTGFAMALHQVGDQFVVLNTATLERVSYGAGSIGQTEILRGITIGRTEVGAIAVRYPFTAESLEPYAPVNLHAVRDGSDNWDISWMRQDRLRTRAFWSPANSEATESYTLRILDDLGVVLRTVTVTGATTYEYSLADQLTDFGASQTVLNFSVSQTSAVTGNGHIAQASLGIDYDYPGTIVSDSPVAYFRFEEATGTVATDEIGSFDGTYVGSPVLQQAPLFRTGRSITLGGSGDYVTWGTTAFIQNWIIGIEIGINITAFPLSGYDAVLVHENNFSPNASLYLLVGSDSKLRLILYRSGGAQVLNLAGAALSAGTDYHVIINIGGFGSGAAMDIYINDASYASGTTSNSWSMDATNDGVMHLGHSNSGGYGDLDGTVDDLSIWSSVQNAAQRTDHFLRGGIA